jgi:Ulp1 family protease
MLAGSLPSDVLSSRRTLGGEHLIMQDARSLCPGEFVSDTCVQEYMDLLARASLDSSFFTQKGICFFNPFFYTQLAPLHVYDYTRVRGKHKWVLGGRRCTFGALDVGTGEVTAPMAEETYFVPGVCVVPVHTPQHWTLLVVDFLTKRFIYCDSLWNNESAKTAKRVSENFQRYIFDCAHDDFFGEYDFFGWTVHMPANLPQQPDGYNCAIFMCQFARRVMDDLQLCRPVQDPDALRRVMLAEILSGGLHYLN